MKKNGFTLVELLAVIAILAILVIMALPAVLRMYRESRIRNFQNEVRTVYRTAQSQFLADSTSLGSGQTIAYTNAGTSVTGVNVVKELDMTGNSNFKYYVLINVDGKVLNVRASNGTYSFSKQASDATHDLKIDDIDVETNNDVALDSDITTTVCPVEEATYNSGSSSSLGSVGGMTFVTRQNAGSITIGDELVVEDEHFYVLNPNSNNKLILLPAKNINTSTLRQDDSANTVAFSSTRYWCNDASYISNSVVGDAETSNNGIIRLSTSESIAAREPGTCDKKNTYSGTLEEEGHSGGNPWPYVYDSNNPSYTYVNQYVEYLKTSGVSSTTTAKFLDVEDLISSNYVTTNYNYPSSIDSTAPSWLYSTNYWTGNAYGGENLFVIYTQGTNIGSVGGNNNSSYGIRPIIIIPLS